MKKSIIMISFFLIMLGLFFYVISISTVNADSGFDSSYDSGGGWDSGSDWSSSDWDSGSDWDSNGSSNTSDMDLGATLLIILLIIIFVLLCYFFKFIVNKFKDSTIGIKISNAFIDCNIIIKLLIITIILLIIGFVFGFEFIIFLIVCIVIGFISSSGITISLVPKKGLNKKRIKKLSNNDIVNLLGKNFDIKEFKNQVFNIYKDLQIAWMNFDDAKIKELVNDEMYNMYINQLETLKIKNQKNIMEDIKKIECEITDYYKSNNKEIFKIYLKVKCYDYIIDTETNKVMRGKKYRKLTLGYILTFENNIDTIEHCPQCAADIKNTTECPYCKTKIVNNTSELKMIKKEIISQK